MNLREEDVLQPRKSNDLNSDDWPEFKLKQVKITSYETGQDVSLLSAHHGNPIKVSGKLDTVDSHLMHLVRNRQYKDKSIDLNHVTFYAFAEFHDGTYGFWAAGKSGWFELQTPATPYKPTFDKMNEATSILYTLADRWRRGRTKASVMNNHDLCKHAQKAFRKYSEKRTTAHDLPDDGNDAHAIFYEHKDFLITSMLEGQDGLDWSRAPMLKYFKLKFPDDYATIEARILRPAVSAQSTPKEILADNRDDSRKRKSQSPHEEPTLNKRQRRKAAREADSRIQMLPKNLHPETPQTKQPLGISLSDEDQDGDLNVVGRKCKSILQPSGGKFSKKGTLHSKGLRQRGTVEYNEDPGSDERIQLEESPITTLRSGRELELLTNPPPSGSSPEATSSPKFLPRKYLELKIVEYDLPLTEPQGPGDVWTCTFEGCFRRIHEASTLGGKSRIKAHFRSHASQAQEKIDLVLNESRPYLPVDNLVRRLQAFAPEPGIEAGPESLSRKFSAPIRRRY